jgi:predicted nuclease of predicted toxin-antitoxin system
MTFLIDQGLPRSTVKELADRGFSAVHVADLGMFRATDSEILDVARHHDAIVVTLDSDFHTLLADDSSTSPSVIRIRIEGLKSPQIAEILEQVNVIATPELVAGAAVSVTPVGVRIRLLPLV